MSVVWTDGALAYIPLLLPICGHQSLQWNTCEKRLLAITNVRRALVYEPDAMLVRNECARRGYSDVDHFDVGAGVWLIAHLTCARIQPQHSPAGAGEVPHGMYCGDIGYGKRATIWTCVTSQSAQWIG